MLSPYSLSGSLEVNWGGLKDSYGLYVGAMEDPGDSCHRTCSVALMGFTPLVEFLFQLDKLRCSENPNNYRRHCSPGWWSEDDRFSVDQAIALIAALATLRLRKTLIRFLFGIIKRGSFMTNTRMNGATKENHGQQYKTENGKPIFRDYSWKVPDFFGPRDWAFALRTWELKILYPFILIADILLLLNAIKRRIRPDNDPLNYIIRTRFATYYQPTIASNMIEKIEDTPAIRAAVRKYSERTGFPYDKLFDSII